MLGQDRQDQKFTPEMSRIWDKKRRRDMKNIKARFYVNKKWIPAVKTEVKMKFAVCTESGLTNKSKSRIYFKELRAERDAFAIFTLGKPISWDFWKAC